MLDTITNMSFNYFEDGGTHNKWNGPLLAKLVASAGGNSWVSQSALKYLKFHLKGLGFDLNALLGLAVPNYNAAKDIFGSKT